MATKKTRSAGMGFNPTPKKIDTSKGYVTLFEKVTEKTNGEKHGLSWYKQTVNTIAAQFKKEPERLIKDERRDSKDLEDYQDENILRRRAVMGHLYFFEYEARMKYLPYYDKFPLVYVLRSTSDHIIGANLHYIEPKKRIPIINKLKDGRIDIPKHCIHKYINDHVKSLFVDLASAEWETCILLPVEDFVTTKNSGKIPYDRELVWKETNEKYQDKLKGERIIKGYGKPEDIERVK
jgi:hypothetical protein